MPVHCHLQMHRAMNLDLETQVRSAPQALVFAQQEYYSVKKTASPVWYSTQEKQAA